MMAETRYRRHGKTEMDRTFVFNGHEYRYADGRIYDSTGELIGTVVLDVARG